MRFLKVAAICALASFASSLTFDSHHHRLNGVENSHKGKPEQRPPQSQGKGPNGQRPPQA
jgi:hypothetical protein